MRVIFFIDLLVFSKFQEFSLWFQKMTGITCFGLAKFFAKVAVIAITLNYILRFFADKHKVFLIIDSFFWIYCIWAFWRFSLLCEELDEKYAEGFEFINERIINSNFTSYRIALLFLSIFYIGVSFALFFIANTWGVVALSFAVFAAFLTSYFVVCTPLPPGKSKLKKWFTKAKEKVQEMTLPTPEPCPVSNFRGENAFYSNN